MAEAPEDLLPGIRTKDDLVEFVASLRAHLENHPEDWENTNLHDFLQALQGWLADMDQLRKNLGQPLQHEPDWRTVAEMLLATAVYE